MATMWCRNERWTLQRIAFFQSKGGWSIRFTHKTSRVFLDVCIPGNSIWPFFGLVQRPFQRLIDPQLRIKTSLWITWYIVLHTYHCTYPIGYDILVVPSSPPQPNRICHFRFWLQQEGILPQQTTGQLFLVKQTTYDSWSNSLPPKKRRKQMCHRKFFSWTFWELFYIIIYVFS